MKIAICPGSFDPVTLGHIDVIQRATMIFDKVVVVVMKNSAKDNSMFTIDERVDFLKKSTAHIKNVEVDTFEGLLVDYAKHCGAIAVVKGLRAVSDFDYEFQQSLTNKRINPDVETVFLTASAENMFLSSSIVKEVCRLGGDISSFVPEIIHDDIYNRCKGE